MTKLLLASNNQGKQKEILALLDGLDIELLLPADIGLELEVEEDGRTYAENAALKASAFAEASGLPTLGDDSGLEVDALGGEPGLHSARFSPIPGASDADRRRLLIERLRGKTRPWTARFRCVVALARPHVSELQYASGTCEGEILEQEHGVNGFGYDPIFYIPELGRTMAELTMDEKNEVSHRARAVKAAIPLLRSIL